MIKSSACRDTEKLFNDQRVCRLQSFERQARKRLMVLHAAPNLEALMLNPGNKFHSLKGARKGQYAISINKQWRVCFEWHDTEYDLRMMKRKIWSDIERRIIPIKTSEPISEKRP